MARLGRLSAVTALTAIAMGVAACGSGSNSGSSSGGGGALKIGVPVPLSGDYASAGQDILNGARLAAKDINAKGGVGGHKIQIIPQDDACQAQTAAQAAQKLISQGINAAAGGYCSTAALPELSSFHRAGIPYVMDASTNPQLTEQGFAEAFRTIGRDDEQGPFVAKFITGFLKMKKVAVLNDNTTYSKGLADSTSASLKRSGAQVVYFNALTPGQSDYTSVLTRIAQSHPQILYYSGYYPEFGLLVKEAQQLGLKFQLMGGDANNDPTLINTAGNAANGVYVDTAPLAQFLSSAQGFVSGYTSSFGKAPGPYSVYEYDAVGVVAQAVKSAKSTSPKAITAALSKIKSYQGITGQFGFDSKGDREPVNYIVTIVKDGKFVAYKKYDQQSGQWVNMD